MNCNINNIEKTNELKNRILELRNELLSVLDKWFELVNIVQPRILFQYDSIFGDLESEIDDKLKLARTLERKSQLINTKIKSGEKVTKNTIEFIEQVVEKEIEIVNRYNSNYYSSNSYSNNNQQHYDYFSFSSKKQKTSFQGFSYTTSKENIKNKSSNNNYYFEKESISTCYRMIVKKLHPDVSDSKELFEKYWNNIQTAYKSKDEHRINLYYWSLCVIDDLIKNQKEEEIYNTTIKTIENEIFKEKHNLENAYLQEPYNLEEKLSDAFWIIRRKRQLRDKIFQIDRKIIQHKHLLQNMISTQTLHYCVA